MSAPVGERIAKIEALLESLLRDQAKFAASVESKIDKLTAELQDTKSDHEKHKSRLAGLIAGVGLTAGSVGAGVAKLFGIGQ